MIWLGFAAMALAVLAVVLWPLLKGVPQALDRNVYGVSVFKDQLTEVERDLARGVITATEAEAARLEIQRRLLAATKSSTVSADDDPAKRAGLTAAMAVLVPFLALGIYMSLGAPDLPQQQSDARAADDLLGDMDVLVEQLAARVNAEPENPQGWALLSRTYRQLGRFPEALDAFRRLMTLVPNDAMTFAEFGELNTAAAGGTINAEAHDAFVASLRQDRNEPRAQFYLGLEQAQTGNAQNAIAIWRALTAGAPADAPWLATVREQMAQIAQEAGAMPMAVEPRHALDVLGEPAPTDAPLDPQGPDVSAVQERFSPENLTMIQGMVGGLAARLENQPEDFDGWMMLGRSYIVLKNMEGAAAAYEKAITLRPDDVTAMMAQELKRNPQQPEALFVLGLTRVHAGDAANARDLWTEADAGASPELKAEIARRLSTLK
jgi:cytochrome c-type biogenesis protein CcmH